MVALIRDQIRLMPSECAYSTLPSCQFWCNRKCSECLFPQTTFWLGSKHNRHVLIGQMHAHLSSKHLAMEFISEWLHCSRSPEPLGCIYSWLFIYISNDHLTHSRHMRRLNGIMQSKAGYLLSIFNSCYIITEPLGADASANISFLQLHHISQYVICKY